MADSRRSGFTLIELLVVIAIIAVLGVFLVPRLIPALRQTDRTACAANLKNVHAALVMYQTRYKMLPPRRSGPDFLMALVDCELVARSKQDLRILICPSVSGEVQVAPEEFSAENTDYTGPDQTDTRKAMKLQQKGAEGTVVVCDRCPATPAPDLKDMPHDGEGISVLFLGGTVEFIEATDFPEKYVVLGPDSPKEELKHMPADQ